MGAGGDQQAASSASGAVVHKEDGEVFDFVYGLQPNSPTGGCVVQRSFENDLRGAAGIGEVNVYVASDPASARGVFELLRQRKQQEEDRRKKGREVRPSGVLIVDGIALLFLRDRLEELRGSRRVMAGFIHSPFSEPFYREESWLRAAVPEHMLLDRDGAALRAEEIRLFSLFDKIVAVGAPCRSLLTEDYGVAKDAIVLLEPTFSTPRTTLDAADAAAVDPAIPAPAPGLGSIQNRAGSAPRFVSVGTLCPRKGQLALIAALKAACASNPKELGGSVLTLIGGDGGNPSYAEAVRRAAADVGGYGQSGADGEKTGRESSLEVRLLGPLPHAETLQNVGANDAFLLNSSQESWAIAPVEAALRGVPVLSTRVGWLTRALPPESTVWVGSGDAGQEGTAAGAPGDGLSLASSKEWEEALTQFAYDRQLLKSRAERATPDLARRFSQAAVVSRAQAVQAILKATNGRSAYNPECSSGVIHGPDFPNRGCTLSQGAADEEQERVRRATVMNALACVCATCLSISGLGGAVGGLLALVAVQCLLVVSLAPPCSPANLVTIFRSFIPPAVVWCTARSDFGEVAMTDVSWFGLLFVCLDVVDGILARRSKTGPTLVGAALDVESDSVAVLFLSLVASRKAWSGGFIAGVLRYLFVLATGARELPPSPIGPAGRWFAKVAALVSVVALAASIGNCPASDSDNDSTNDGRGGTWEGEAGTSTWWDLSGGWMQGRTEGSSHFLCAVGVAVLCASFSVDFFQIWILLPRATLTSLGRNGGEAMAHRQTKSVVLRQRGYL